jgi:SAM-dependent methyltransferase
VTASAVQSFRTFRDPAGSLHIERDRALRMVRPEFAVSTKSFLDSALARELMDSGQMIATKCVGTTEGGGLELEHKRVMFPSYPWEWCAEQWIDAATLTLDICDKLLDQGLILKDATPLNILFCGSRPVLVDVLSVEKRDAQDPIWNAYGQFVRTFVLPLMAHKYLGWPLAAARIRRDGYEPDELYPYLSLSERYLSPARGLVTIPMLLDRFGRSGTKPLRVRLSADACKAILRSRLHHLKKIVLKLRPAKKKSAWSDYTSHRSHYSEADRTRKEAFIQNAVRMTKTWNVLDIGANTGQFSRLVVAAGARVVAIDTDEASTGIHYENTHKNRQPVLALCADIARPTPSAGWKNLESFSLLDRFRKRFDGILMLGLMHHLLVSDQIPLAEIASLVAELAPQWLVVEWVPPTDPKFVEICRGRDARYKDLNEETFLKEFSPYFISVRYEALDNGRILHLMQAR